MYTVFTAARSEIFHGEHKAHVPLWRFPGELVGLPVFTVLEGVVCNVGHKLMCGEADEPGDALIRTDVPGLLEEVLGDLVGDGRGVVGHGVEQRVRFLHDIFEIFCENCSLSPSLSPFRPFDS